MPLYRIAVFKRWGQSRPWTNVYHIQAAGVVPAADNAIDIVTSERSFHSVLVSFMHYRVSSVEENDDQYVIRPINLMGQQDTQSGLLPLFNTVRVDFATAAIGRPDRKYYRGLLGEAQITNAGVEPAFVTLMDGAAEALIQTMSSAGFPLRSYQGDLWQAASVHTEVQMRQLHRKRKKAALAQPPGD